MKIFRYPERERWSDLLLRPVMEIQALDQIVGEILNRVRQEGDQALLEYTLKFDKVSLDTPAVSDEEFQAAEAKVDSELKAAIRLAIANIRKFHEAQMPREVRVETMPGVECWQKGVAIQKVGLYVPGGTAPLFSTVLMLAVPAVIAGCQEIVLCSPPGKDGKLHPAILYAAKEAGVKKVFKAGGAQAIAAMAYGTESIPGVNKIFGPGNQFVTAAKQLVSRGDVAIDLPAGPSEVAVLADQTSNPVFVASDLLSQAEHGVDSQVILISTSGEFIDTLLPELNRQLEMLPRKEFAARALENSKAILVNSYDDMMELVNEYAAEHLIISTANADELAGQVRHAGSVFIGEFTPESAGDYASGTNHTLPTNGYAKTYSGVNLDAYFKKITYQKISREGLKLIGPAIEKMALAEELTAHQRAVALRLNQTS
ncbi:MAG: histidinol dehydrogenase [Bacteroidales bacterium]|nr:histidinol dehydrogenase [Bacteroidales bacterium]